MDSNPISELRKIIFWVLFSTHIILFSFNCLSCCLEVFWRDSSGGGRAPPSTKSREECGPSQIPSGQTRAWTRDMANGCVCLGPVPIKTKPVSPVRVRQAVSRHFYVHGEVGLLLERFWIECRKTKTRAITLGNHSRCKERRKEPIRTRSKYV